MAVALPYLYAAAIAATAASTYITYKSNKQAAKAAESVGEANANLELQQAKVTEDQSQAEAETIRDNADRLRATQRTTFLKSGLTLDSGTAQDVIYDSSIQGELDALNVLYRGNVSAGFSRKQSAISRYEGAAGATRYRGAAIGGLFSGASEGLSLATKMNFSGSTPKPT